MHLGVRLPSGRLPADRRVALVVVLLQRRTAVDVNLPELIRLARVTFRVVRGQDVTQVDRVDLASRDRVNRRVVERFASAHVDVLPVEEDVHLLLHRAPLLRKSPAVRTWVRTTGWIACNATRPHGVLGGELAHSFGHDRIDPEATLTLPFSSAQR